VFLKALPALFLKLDPKSDLSGKEAAKVVCLSWLDQWSATPVCELYPYKFAIVNGGNVHRNNSNNFSPSLQQRREGQGILAMRAVLAFDVACYLIGAGPAGDVLGSRRCHCRQRISQSLRRGSNPRSRPASHESISPAAARCNAQLRRTWGFAPSSRSPWFWMWLVFKR